MRLKWKIKMSAIVIIALAIILLAYNKLEAYKMVSAEEKVVEEMVTAEPSEDNTEETADSEQTEQKTE